MKVGVVNVEGGECRGWWTSHFTKGMVNVGGGECRGWWTSHFMSGGGKPIVLVWLAILIWRNLQLARLDLNFLYQKKNLSLQSRKCWGVSNVTITKTKQQTNDIGDGKGDSSIYKLHQREGGEKSPPLLDTKVGGKSTPPGGYPYPLERNLQKRCKLSLYVSRMLSTLIDHIYSHILWK